MRGEPISFGPFLLSPDDGTLLKHGEPVLIGQRCASLLVALLKKPGEVRTKAELMDAAWPGTAVEESNLSVQIAALRKALGPSPNGGEWIVTIPRIGYRFLGESGATAPVRPVGAISEPLIPSLAVLPFVNLSGDDEQDYFADGVVEDIITALSRFKSFAVIARNSSFIYKGRAVDVRRVAQELGVRYVLEGSVRRAGNRARIGAQLVDAATGAHRWAQNFDGELDAVFDFQDRITEGVAMRVEPHIEMAEIERSRVERPTSLAAYDLYLRALSKRFAETLVENGEAWELLSRALVLEPDNPLFLGYLSWIIGHRHAMGWPPFGSDDRQRCAELARAGIRHARGDARAMALCAGQLIHVSKEYDWGMAVMEAAVEANPNDLLVVLFAGIAHLHCGSIEDALAFLHRAIRLSPRDPIVYFSLTGIAHAQMILGNYPEALAWALRSLALNANFGATHWMLIAANAQLGRMDEARRLLTEFKKISPEVTVQSIWAGQPQKDPVRLAAILDGLRLAGLDEDKDEN